MAHRAHVAHSSRGRLRIRVPSAKGNAEALEEIRLALSSVAGVNEVSVNHSIGTVTVEYDPSRHEELHKHLTTTDSPQKITLERAPSLSDLSIDRIIEKEAVFLSGHSHMAKALFDMVNRLDQEVKRGTGNAIDLKVIAPLALAVGAFMGLGVTASTPVWLTLGLFSFNHFIDLNSQHSGPPGPDPQSEGQPVNPPARRRTPRFP